MYISNEEYHRSEKYNKYLSSSQIKQAYKSGRNTLIKYKEKTAFNLGTAYHTHILEPDRIEKDIIVKPDKIDRRTKIGKKKYESFIKRSGSKTVIDDNQAEILEEMIDSVYSHKVAIELLKMKDNKPEHSMFCEDKETGMLFKVRTDIINIKRKIIIDLKSCQSSEPNKFKWQAKRFGYDLSAYHYLRCANQIYGDGFIFLFICTETIEPFNTTVFFSSNEFLKSGEKKWKKGLGTIKSGDTISHYSEKIETLE